MISAVTNPPRRPIQSQLSAASGSTCISFHGQSAATITSASRIVVLLMVPGIVIRSSRTPGEGSAAAGLTKPPNDFDDRTGFDVLSMTQSLRPTRPCGTPAVLTGPGG